MKLQVTIQKSKNMSSILNYDYILYSSTPLFEQNFSLTANIKFYAWILTPLMFSPCNFKRFKVVTAKHWSRRWLVKPRSCSHKICTKLFSSKQIFSWSYWSIKIISPEKSGKKSDLRDQLGSEIFWQNSWLTTLK